MPGFGLASHLSSPDFDAPVEVQADWLELAAFFSSAGQARIEELIAQQDLEWNQEPSDIAEADALLEDIASKVISEIEERSYDLEGAYPFAMTADGSALVLEQNWTAGQSVYLFALIVSHAVRSELVPSSLAPDDAMLRQARDLFQLCSTLAAAGHTGGPAYSIGWPRPDRSGFLKKLKEIWAEFRDGSPRDEPLPGTPDQIKDEGIDVISWWPERDRQPGPGYLLGQVASGHDWKDKSILPQARRFLTEWFDVQPVATPHPATFIPYTVSDVHMRRTSSMHGYVIHRGRLPRLAGLASAVAQGGALVERLDEVDTVQRWLRNHLARLGKRMGA